MYETLKTWAKSLLPNEFFVKNERVIRSFITLGYLGNSYQCNICLQKLSKFQTKSNGDKMCPRCGSLSRTRRLWNTVTPTIQPGDNILHFSPSRSLFRKFNKLGHINYVSSDYENEFLADKKYDITAIDEPDEQFNIIICYHILEHIEKDDLAMNELFRVLKSDGKCFIQTPFKEGDIYENPEVKTPEARNEHFGQEDHVRIYSTSGLNKRLQQAGFNTEIKSFESDQSNVNGLRSEQMIIATKD